MYSENSKRIWDGMTTEQRLAVLPSIREASERRGTLWEATNEQLAELPYDELHPQFWWDLTMAEDGETFSGEAWERAYEEMTEGKTG
jgi:hypothetical protein